MKDKDYFFYINWEDTQKNPYRVGILAQIDEKFYLKMNNKKNAEFAYARGYIGIPGFEQEKVYSSDELFDFFKSRILNKNSDSPCEELIENSGRSMVDSFSLEKVQASFKNRVKEVILGMYRLQKTKENKKNKKNNNLDEMHNL